MNTPQDYYEQTRPEILRLIPGKPCKVLDIGCGKGGVANMLRSQYPGVKIVGFDKFVDESFDYHTAFDEFHQVDLAGSWPDIEYSSFDLVLLLDVLEHLPEPDQALSRLAERVASTANVLISLPNFHAYSNLIEIVKTGRFMYKDSGILDRTHLRFYGQLDARDLIQTHFNVDRFLPHHLQPRSWLNKVAAKTVGEVYAAYQNIFLCSRKK